MNQTECDEQFQYVKIVNTCIAISFTLCISASTLYTTYQIFCRR